MREFKVVVMGNGGVGKSCVTLQFVHGAFKEAYDPTVEDFYRKDIIYNDVPCIVEILDTAGTDQFSSMLDLYILNGQGFLLIYSISDAQSFVDAQPLREKIFKVRGSKQTPLVLVGNKADVPSIERQVYQKDATNLAAEWLCPFHEVSAKTKLNIDKIFHEIVNLITQTQRPRKLCCCSLL